MPNIRLVSLADEILGRNGRMIARDRSDRPRRRRLSKAHPFRLDLE